MRLAFDRATLATFAILASCSGSAEPATPREASLVVTGRVVDAGGSTVDSAIIHIQALHSGRRGGEFGCSGVALVGDWVVFGDANGRYTMEMRLTTMVAPVCVVLLGNRLGDSVWRDTASVVAPFKPVVDGIAPDTVRLDLRFGP